MSREIKYTTDGKKVVVIGNLNSQEKIVQEIFFVDGQEIPSGENFVVKSLHDSPAVSWKEKNLQDLEKQYADKSAFYIRERDRFDKMYKEEFNIFREKTSYLKKVLNKVSLESFDLLIKFLTNDIKYIVIDSYSPEIIEFKDFRCDYDKERLKLITIFGKDDGSLTWGVNRYSDGSGSNSICYPFSTEEEALNKLKELMSAKDYITEDLIKKAKKYNISLSEEKVSAFKLKQIEHFKGSIANYEKSAEDYRKRIVEMEIL